MDGSLYFGRSLLLSRGVVTHGVGEVEIKLNLDYLGYEFCPGETLRVSISSTDWPNVIAPVKNGLVEVIDCKLTLSILTSNIIKSDLVTFNLKDNDVFGIICDVTRDMLNNKISVKIRHSSSHDTDEIFVEEKYEGYLEIDELTWEQRLEARTIYKLTGLGRDIETESKLNIIARDNLQVNLYLFVNDYISDISFNKSWRDVIVRKWVGCRALCVGVT